MNYSSGGYLIHHGVKGQKWGNRKYQYEDGSLTPEGREHYGVDKPDTLWDAGRIVGSKQFYQKEYQKQKLSGASEEQAQAEAGKAAVRGKRATNAIIAVSGALALASVITGAYNYKNS